MRTFNFLLFVLVSSCSLAQTLTKDELLGPDKVGEHRGVAILILNVTHPFTIAGNKVNEQRKSLMRSFQRTPQEQQDLITLNTEFCSLYSYGDPIAAKEYNSNATPKRVFTGTVEQPPTFIELLFPEMTMTQAQKLLNATSTVILDGIPYQRSKKYRINIDQFSSKSVTLDELVAKAREQTRK